MILTDMFDYDKNEIDTGKIYYDYDRGVSDIHIVTNNGVWMAHPEGLDAEKLVDVCNSLVIQK